MWEVKRMVTQGKLSGSKPAPALVPPMFTLFPETLARGERSGDSLHTKRDAAAIPDRCGKCCSVVNAFRVGPRAYLDRDFTVEEFTDGAKQAFSFVSRLLSQCNFDALENLVSSEILKDVKEKCLVLSDNYRNALAAESDEIMYSFPGDVAIYYDDNGMCEEQVQMFNPLRAEPLCKLMTGPNSYFNSDHCHFEVITLERFERSR
ncbi:unnamed protein product [Ranitomeya imitator]|uniref:Uncharacterized protein n=1 Tax=Ranitomeya imitator TaxID=111125 RepID=A0ABN9MDL4_9NEOB|nr:unnamed protein product [Ranitomeya imitator]